MVSCYLPHSHQLHYSTNEDEIWGELSVLLDQLFGTLSLSPQDQQNPLLVVNGSSKHTF